MKGLREATEEEARYVKKHIMGNERAAIAIFVFGIIIILTGIAFMIKTLIAKGSVPFAIMSIIIQLAFLGIVYLLIKLIRDTAKKMGTVKRGEFMITEGTIVDVSVTTSYKHSRARIKVETSDGKKHTFTSSDTCGPAAKRGRKAYIVEIGSGEDVDHALVPRKEK